SADATPARAEKPNVNQSRSGDRAAPNEKQEKGRTMISGVHTIIYSKQPDADRAFLRDVLGLPHVDVGEGWLIFGLPPSEVAIHPAEQNGVHELYLMCDDVQKFIAGMAKHGISCTAAQNLGWGVRTQLSLPGGGKLGVYQPRHARPKSASPARPSA